MDENWRLGSIRSVGALIHSKRACNKIFSLSHKLLLKICSKLMCNVSNSVSAQNCILKCLPFFWEHIFSMQFLIKYPSVKGHADFAGSAATIKLALTAASLCDLAFVKNPCLNTPDFFLTYLPSGAFVPCPDACICHGALFHSVLLCWIISLRPHCLHTEDTQLCLLHLQTYYASHLSWKVLYSKSTFRLSLFFRESSVDECKLKIRGVDRQAWSSKSLILSCVVILLLHMCAKDN